MHQRTRTPLLAAIIATSLAMAGATYASPQEGKRDQYRSEHREMSQKEMSKKDMSKKQMDKMSNKKQASNKHRGQKSSRSTAQLDRNNRVIAQMAMDVNTGSIRLSELADDRARSDRLKQFARNAVEENRDANRKLAAMSKNLRLTNAAPTAMDQWAIDRLRQIRNPREFERAYTELMVARSRMNIDRLQLLAEGSGTDRQLKRFAQQQLGDIRDRLQVVQRIENRGDYAAASNDE